MSINLATILYVYEHLFFLAFELITEKSKQVPREKRANNQQCRLQFHDVQSYFLSLIQNRVHNLFGNQLQLMDFLSHLSHNNVITSAWWGSYSSPLVWSLSFRTTCKNTSENIHSIVPILLKQWSMVILARGYFNFPDSRFKHEKVAYSQRNHNNFAKGAFTVKNAPHNIGFKTRKNCDNP